MKCSCFKCGKSMSSGYLTLSNAVEQENYSWEAPFDGVSFRGGWNIDGLYVEVVICDDCLRAAKGTDRLTEDEAVLFMSKYLTDLSKDYEVRRISDELSEILL